MSSNSLVHAWNYYYEVALRMGCRDEDVQSLRKVKDREALESLQGPFSVKDFYLQHDCAVRQHDFSQKHRLMAAFLGDQAPCGS